jgi:Xaa-Pro dipeptidase
MTAELEVKLNRLREFCRKNNFDGVYLSKRANFAWLTCGGNNTVNRSTDAGNADILVTGDGVYVVVSEIERYRILEEELSNLPGFELLSFPWGSGEKEKALRAICQERRIACDLPLFGFPSQDGPITGLRSPLTPEEVARMRRIAKESAASFELVCRSVKPGESEYEVAARLMSESIKAGGDAPVVLVAFDERIAAYRHPAPTAKRLAKRALLVRGSQKAGLIVSISRMITIGKPETDFRERYEACARINAEMISATLPGTAGSEIFARTVDAYARAGYPEEWKRHHQGGASGYSTRDYLIDSSCDKQVVENQLFAWNPTVSGTKIEDTILIHEQGQEILTEMTSWPSLEFSVQGSRVKCPDILVL